MKIAILTSGILPVPAVQGGAVENLIDFYLKYNKQHHLHDITIYSVWNKQVEKHTALKALNNHYYYIDTTSFWAKLKRRIYKTFHKTEYYNYYIEYYFEQAYEHIKNKNYDYIILENRPGYALKLSQRGHSNLILHLHNDLLNNTTPHYQKLYTHFCKILTVSDYIKDRVSSIIPNNKIQTVYNGIDLTQFSKKDKPTISRDDIGLSSNEFVVVFSGRINKDKGISELIDAILFLQDIPQIKLLVIGSTFFGNAPNENDFVRSLKTKAQRIKEKIIFTGFIPYQQMPDYLQLADIAVLPSIWSEPLGLTCIEAMAMGLPIVTTRQGGIPETVTSDCATILDITPNLSENLAASIRNLYNYPQKREFMSKAALKRSQHFSEEQYAHDFLNALNN